MADPVADYPWPTGRWVRALVAITLEGKHAGPDGRSGSISGPADRAVLGAVRCFSDAVVVGASTMRIERYNPMRPVEAVQAERLAQGLAPASRLVIVSASLDLPWQDPVYAESTLPPLIVTVESAPTAARDAVPSTCELLVAPGVSVDPHWLLAELAARGLDRIVCEGGPRLLDDFARAGVIDEWALSLSGHVAHGDYVPVLARAEEEFVFTRFVRQGEG
jgi:riboflavin biosynthesis pyrimidine reductase